MPDKKKLPRRETMPKDSAELVPPETLGYEYLLDYSNEIRRYSYGAAGIVPVSWQEIDAWKRLTGTQISDREAIALRYLSIAYVTEFNQASQPHAIAPFVQQQEEPQSLDDKLRTMFRSMSRKRKSG